MNRRKFLKWIGIGAGAAIAAKDVLADLANPQPSIGSEPIKSSDLYKKLDKRNQLVITKDTYRVTGDAIFFNHKARTLNGTTIKVKVYEPDPIPNTIAIGAYGSYLYEGNGMWLYLGDKNLGMEFMLNASDKDELKIIGNSFIDNSPGQAS